MKKYCQVRITAADYDRLMTHCFPGDDEEHGAVALAGLVDTDDQPILTVRELHIAKEGTDYVEGKIGYRALAPEFIHRMITRARDERLAYLAIHNHFSDRYVDFSQIDLDSHERGYPALLQIAKGMPVGALVCGRNSMQADLWMPGGGRRSLQKLSVVGRSIRTVTPTLDTRAYGAETYDRQVRFLGSAGQSKLKQTKVGIIGLGGVGSLVAEYLARLGVGSFVLIDDDIIELSNLSRIVGASFADALGKSTKMSVACKLIMEANSYAEIEPLIADVAKESVARRLVDCDFLFLAADSMRARLVFNAIVHQYLIPGVQIGSKVSTDPDGNLLDLLSVNRPVRPNLGCLWCNELVDPTQLAKEAKSDEERKDQAYGVEEPNPSVITLNAVAASHAVNDFLLDYLNLRGEMPVRYEHFHFLREKRMLVEPTMDAGCTECGREQLRFARGDTVDLPCTDG